MIDGDRDWFWHTFSIGAVAFAILLVIILGSIASMVYALSPLLPLLDTPVCLAFMVVVSILGAYFGAVEVVHFYEHKILGMGEPYGGKKRYRSRKPRW